MLKLYTYDLGWCGAVIVVAETVEQATDLIKANKQYKRAMDYQDEPRFSISNLSVDDIKSGITITVRGDC